MPKDYEQWNSDPTLARILEQLKLDNLDPKVQEVLEKSVHIARIGATADISVQTKTLSRLTGLPKLRLAYSCRTLANALARPILEKRRFRTRSST
ncbi:MAG: hypothetical protein UY33_C0010G0024 [Candidatus Amesbacteria bacterium GW2011_GWA1_48_9]|uniref:Uncharacterized protein n=1 Tax=Candidatus Amesbacteria bacterium GW2011_GWA1_48_9 TaxID=1618355 RepID=A0A0G1V1Y7_9BACT|nr:MAG: hypothetical protein UY33_C0010G0024 [Candidatus Amesbacteria bacterium GW2011_GWA1_48_9]